jgi:hypothetical protein
MSPWRFFGDVSDTISGCVLAIIVLLGTLLCAALVVAAPGMIAWALIREGRTALGGLVAALMAVTIFGVVQDFRRQRMSWVTATLAAIWTLCVVYVAARMLIA